MGVSVPMEGSLLWGATAQAGQGRRYSYEKDDGTNEPCRSGRALEASVRHHDFNVYRYVETQI